MSVLILLVTGAALVVGGVGLLAGAEWAMVVAGVFLLAAGVDLDRSPRPPGGS